jgi:hypothetical protein
LAVCGLSRIVIAGLKHAFSLEMAMKKILVLATAAGMTFAYANVASAATAFCAAPGGGGVAISCGSNADGSLSASCSCPAGYVLIDTTQQQPENSSSTPAVPSQT